MAFLLICAGLDEFCGCCGWRACCVLSSCGLAACSQVRAHFVFRLLLNKEQIQSDVWHHKRASEYLSSLRSVAHLPRKRLFDDLKRRLAGEIVALALSVDLSVHLNDSVARIVFSCPQSQLPPQSAALPWAWVYWWGLPVTPPSVGEILMHPDVTEAFAFSQFRETLPLLCSCWCSKVVFVINVGQLFVSTMLLTHVLACAAWRSFGELTCILPPDHCVDCAKVWYWLGSEAW